MHATLCTSIKERSIIKKLFKAKPAGQTKLMQLRTVKSDVAARQGKSVLIAISKRTGKACKRNLLRRRIRHILVQNSAKIPDSFDFAVLQPRPSTVDLSFEALKLEVEKLFFIYESNRS